MKLELVKLLGSQKASRTELLDNYQSVINYLRNNDIDEEDCKIVFRRMINGYVIEPDKNNLNGNDTFEHLFKEFLSNCLLSFPSNDLGSFNRYFDFADAMLEAKDLVRSSGHETNECLLLLSGLPHNPNNSHIKLISNYLEGISSQANCTTVHVVFTLERIFENKFFFEEMNLTIEEMMGRIENGIKARVTNKQKLKFFWPKLVENNKYALLSIVMSYLKSIRVNTVFLPMGIISPNLLKPFLVKLNKVYLPFNVNNFPDRYCNIFVHPGSPRLNELKRSFKDVTPVRIDWPVNPLDFSVNTDKDFDLGELNLVIVLGNGRLNGVFDSFSETDWHSLMSIVSKYFKTVQFIGGVSEENQSKIHGILEQSEGGQKLEVSYLDYAEDLASIYLNKDVLIELPNSNGGGYGALTAIFQNVLVLAYNGTDISHYSNQENVYTSLDHLEKVLGSVTAETSKYRDARSKNFNRVIKELDSESIMAPIFHILSQPKFKG